MPVSIRKYAAKSKPCEQTWLLRLVYQAFCCEKTGCARRYQNLPHTSENQIDPSLAKTIYQRRLRCGLATGRTLLALGALFFWASKGGFRAFGKEMSACFAVRRHWHRKRARKALPSGPFAMQVRLQMRFSAPERRKRRWSRRPCPQAGRSCGDRRRWRRSGRRS